MQDDALEHSSSEYFQLTYYSHILLHIWMLILGNLAIWMILSIGNKLNLNIN